MRQSKNGFTLVELIVVLVLLGILSAYAAPRFSGRSGYSELAVQQDIKQSLRYAQQLAMSQTDHTISFIASANSIDVLNNGASVGGNYPKAIPNDVTLSPANLLFTSLGATTDASITVTNSDTQNSLQVNVIGSTGFAHD